MKFSVIFLFICISRVWSDHGYPSKADSSYRLPKSIKPIGYVLTLEPTFETNPNASSFNGSIVMEIEALINTNNITFHTANLNINETTITITDKNGTSVKFRNTTIDTVREFFIIHLEEELQQETTYNLTIGHFNGNLKHKNHGFYLAAYETAQGQQSYLALSNFEPSNARKAFPCFDEPAFKAKFKINLIRPESYISVSNEELISTINLSNGRFQDIFKETVVMSTYIVAFVISDYKYTKRIGKFKIFSTPQAINDNRANYVLMQAPKLLEALEDFTGINYTLNKMDLLTVPDKYYAPGAMENWGLITFSEKYLLYSNITSTTADLQIYTTFTAHELAHQWFGNLVTPTWWKYLWLSEGFAAYFQYHIADVVEPKWRLKEQYVVEHMHLGLENDDLSPMNYEPRYYGTIPSSWIVYYKACAVIRMTEHFLTHSIFKDGLRKYLEERKFNTAKPSNLYNAFQQIIQQTKSHDLLGSLTVSEILSTWDSNKGYPLLTVVRNYENGVLTLSQKLYGNSNTTENSTIWNIPVTYIFQLNTTQTFSDTKTDIWLTEQTIVVDQSFSTDGWLLVNKQQVGYYRVNYDITNWQRIISFLQSEEFQYIHPLNRAQLIDDTFHLAASGYIPYEIPFNLSTYLIQETDLIPLTAFLRNMEVLNLKLTTSNEYDIFQNYIKNLLSGALAHLGFDNKFNDSHIDKLNRMKVLKWLCNFGHSECQHVGLQSLRTWHENSFAVDSSSMFPDLISPLLCGAMQIATFDDWHILLEQYYLTTNVHQKTLYIKALGCTKNKVILNFFFNLISNKSDTITEDDRAAAFIGIIKASSSGLYATVDYLKNNSVDLSFSDKISIGESIGDRITTREQQKQTMVLNLINDKDYVSIEWYSDDNLKWSEKDYPVQISKWLVDYSATNIENYNFV